MNAGEVVSLQRVKAWWAYTEIRSPRLMPEYQRDPRVPPLRAKIETAAFEHLSAFEVAALEEIFEIFRGDLLSHYLVDVREFVIEEWSANQLAQVYAMSELDPLGEGRLPTIRDLCRITAPDGAACAAGSASSSRQCAHDHSAADTGSSCHRNL